MHQTTKQHTVRKCPDCGRPFTTCIEVEDAESMGRFWARVAAHPDNNEATRIFSMAEADHWFGVAALIAEERGLLA
jgi:hypothetical protein